VQDHRVIVAGREREGDQHEIGQDPEDAQRDHRRHGIGRDQEDRREDSAGVGRNLSHIHGE
jgi:hypothetical protein